MYESEVRSLLYGEDLVREEREGGRPNHQINEQPGGGLPGNIHNLEDLPSKVQEAIKRHKAMYPEAPIERPVRPPEALPIQQPGEVKVDSPVQMFDLNKPEFDELRQKINEKKV